MRRWVYFALPILHHDPLIGKADLTADRKAGVHRINAIHQDVRFTKAMTDAVNAEIADLASWLQLTVSLQRRNQSPSGRPPLCSAGDPSQNVA